MTKIEYQDGTTEEYGYDENGNLAEKSILCDAKHAHYKILRYGYRRNGSLQWEEDAEGSAPKPYRELRSTATMACITSTASMIVKVMHI